jgi:hypothetical protein
LSTDYSTYATNTTSYSSAKRIKFETELLKKAKDQFVFARFAKKNGVERGNSTVRFNRVIKPARQETAATEGYVYGPADGKKLYSNYYDVTPTKISDSFIFTDDVSIEAFISDPDNQEVIAEQFMESMERYGMKELGSHCLRTRIDADSSYEFNGTVTTATADGSTIITTDTDSGTYSADDFNGGYVTMTSPYGGAYGETVQVTDTAVDGSSMTLTAPLVNGTTTSSTFKVTIGTGLGASDKLTTAGILRVMAMHRKLKTPTFAGGTIRAFLLAEGEQDIWSDTTWQNTAIYDDSERYGNYRMVRWLSCEHLIANEVRREEPDGTYKMTSAGTVAITPYFGRDAYAIHDWNNGSGEYGVKWMYKDEPDTSDLRNDLRAISWKTKLAVKVLDGTKVIGLMHGYTPILV